MIEYSIVIPVYNSETTITEVVNRVRSTLKNFEKGIQFEIILVNDYSSDNVQSVCIDLINQKKIDIFISLSKNCGQHNALMAGLRHTSGNYVICLDDDLQTIPEEMIKLIKKSKEEGYDVVYGKYVRKMHNVFRNFGTWFNDKMANWLIDKPKDVLIGSYFLAKKYVIDEINKYTEPYTYLAGLVFRVTKNVANVPMDHNKRMQGKSNYTFKKLVSLWFNGFTNFSVKPLRISSVLGAIFAIFGFIYMIVILVQSLFLNSIEIEGWASTIVIVLFLGSIQLLSIGLLGEYIGRGFIGATQTPQYVIKEKYYSDSEKTPKNN